MRSIKSSPRRQHGASLVFGLVFLLVLSIIAITAMRMSLLDERMAGFSREQNIAFQAAETVLRDGEAAIKSKAINAELSFTDTCTNGLCLPATGDVTPRWQSIDWTDSNSRKLNASTAAALINMPSTPRYIVELLGGDDCGGGGRVSAEVLVSYRVSTRAISRGNAIRTLQSRYDTIERTC